MGLIITNIRYDRDAESRRSLTDLLWRHFDLEFASRPKPLPLRIGRTIQFYKYNLTGEQHEEERNEEGKEEREKETTFSVVTATSPELGLDTVPTKEIYQSRIWRCP